jgi:protein O-mannosyl-transferase
MNAKVATNMAARKGVGKRRKSPGQTSSPATKRPSEALYVSLASGVILLAVSACFANSLANGFVFDDHGHVLKDKLLRSIANVPTLLFSSYRPLRDVSYAIDFALWGERAFGFHLTNVFIHAVNTLLVFTLIRRFTRENLTASFAALVFALHPLQADSVAYISGRRDILFSLFYLASFHCYLGYQANLASPGGRPRRVARASALFALFLGFWLLGLLSKEMAASLPLFIFAWNFCDAWGGHQGRPFRRMWRASLEALRRDRWLYILLALALTAYTWYMVVKGGSLRARVSGFEYWGGSFYTNLLTVICVHGWYLKQLVFPTPVVQYSGAFDVATSLYDWRVIVAATFVVGAVAAGFLLLNKDRLMAFAIFSYFILLLPVSHIIPHHELLADHYLYLPLMSFGLFSALVARRAWGRGGLFKRATVGAAIAVLVAFASMTVIRNGVYKDDLTLWQTNYKEAPNSIRAVSSLASAYANNFPARAIDLYKRCIEIEPSYAPAYVSLAYLNTLKEKAAGVEEIIRQGLALPDSRITYPGYEDPNRFRSDLTMALALTEAFQGQPEIAEKLLLEAINFYPVNPQPYVLLARYYHNHDHAKEYAILKRQLAIIPSDYNALQTISTRLIEDKRFDDAIPYLEQILRLVPNDFYAVYQLGQIYRTKTDCANARRYLVSALAAASSDEETKGAQSALTAIEQDCGF